MSLFKVTNANYDGMNTNLLNQLQSSISTENEKQERFILGHVFNIFRTKDLIKEAILAKINWETQIMLISSYCLIILHLAFACQD